MTPEELYAILRSILQPVYEKAYSTEHRKDLMNVSSLVAGAKSYMYHWRERATERAETGRLNPHLLRGSALHDYLSRKLKDFGNHQIIWSIPFDWNDGKQTIQIIGHYDNLIQNTIMIELKTTNQEDIYAHGMMDRAKRQVGAYAKILEYRTRTPYEAFVCVLNDELTCIKLTREEIENGFNFVLNTALEVAREFNKE